MAGLLSQLWERNRWQGRQDCRPISGGGFLACRPAREDTLQKYQERLEMLGRQTPAREIAGLNVPAIDRMAHLAERVAHAPIDTLGAAQEGDEIAGIGTLDEFRVNRVVFLAVILDILPMIAQTLDHAAAGLVDIVVHGFRHELALLGAVLQPPGKGLAHLAGARIFKAIKDDALPSGENGRRLVLGNAEGLDEIVERGRILGFPDLVDELRDLLRDRLATAIGGADQRLDLAADEFLNGGALRLLDLEKARIDGEPFQFERIAHQEHVERGQLVEDIEDFEIALQILFRDFGAVEAELLVENFHQLLAVAEDGAAALIDVGFVVRDVELGADGKARGMRLDPLIGERLFDEDEGVHALVLEEQPVLDLLFLEAPRQVVAIEDTRRADVELWSKISACLSHRCRSPPRLERLSSGDRPSAARANKVTME